MKQTKETSLNRKTVSFRPEICRAIEDIAKQKNVSDSLVIRDAVDKYFSEKETGSITDQNTPVKINDLNTLYPPEVEIPTTSGIDVIELGKDPYVEVDSVYVQLSDILNSHEYSENPAVYTLFVKKMIPISNDITDDCINKINQFAKITKMDEFLDMVNHIKNENISNIFVGYMMNLISATIIITLKYRYSINYEYFQYLTEYDEYSKILNYNGIKEDVDNVLLSKIRRLFGKPSVECLKVKNDSKIVSKLGMITTTVETDILVLPQVYGYRHNSKEICPLKKNEENNLNIIYQQAFNFFDDYTLYVDVYDVALNHYRVWRIGKDKLSSTKFEVEFIQQF